MEYASEDCDDDELSFSPHSKEFLEPRWLREVGASDSLVRSAGRANPSSKSSSMVWGSGCFGILGMRFRGSAAALMVETPSSSSSSDSGCKGGRIVIMVEVDDEDAIVFFATPDLANIPATTAWALAPPVSPKSISISQSSSGSSLSEGAWNGSPSGRSKSASGHSSRASTSVGAGIVGMIHREYTDRELRNLK